MCAAKGAVAAAEAQQLETTARGQAAAAQIIAKGEADAEVTRADGARSAAKMLEEHEVAVDLAKIGATGEALSKSGSTLILGDNPSAVGSMLLGRCLVASHSPAREPLFILFSLSHLIRVVGAQPTLTS